METQEVVTKKVKLYIAMSLDGFIAQTNGSVDWLHELPNPTNSDHGYADFYARITTTVMGFSTYQQLMDWGIDFPYPDKVNYVVTRKQGLEATEFVQFISTDVVSFIQQLKQSSEGDIWLIGGSQLNTLFWENDLIDEFHVFVMPIVLGEGIPLFAGNPAMKQLRLSSSQAYPTGAVRLVYER